MLHQKTLNKLENLTLQKPDKLLTVYLNTDRSDPDQQGGEWKIALKNGFNRLEEYLESAPEEKERLQAIRPKVEDYILSQERKLPRSFIIFASADSGIWETFEPQVPVETSFHWEEKPNLEQLKSLHTQYPNTGLILLQQNQIKILTSALGQLQTSEFMEFDLDTEDWRKSEGPHHADVSMGSSGGKANQQDEYDERLKANQQRWWKSLGSVLDKKAADEKWEKIILVGDKEEADILSENMNKEVHETIQKNLLNENEHKVIEKLLA
ncbi:VLRF1 family aeRF1-type release factor [Rossellomorea aquimaris]|uniref:VLRF1 family aeRF1-type release factor n=1 Tax=Rossellomorea aquimaris TaxID=189382 RepID=UPI001CD1F34B|nr:VLRF1 family aeRF1-type release factor [Rossellomorea aquimaris]MCA1056003.1 VLRF1 family aeRF1-type release factor [Rossellomorea aquimaris]